MWGSISSILWWWALWRCILRLFCAICAIFEQNYETDIVKHLKFKVQRSSTAYLTKPCMIPFFYKKIEFEGIHTFFYSSYENIIKKVVFGLSLWKYFSPKYNMRKIWTLSEWIPRINKTTSAGGHKSCT